MTRHQRNEAKSSPRLVAAVVVTALLSVAATAIALGAVGIGLRGTDAPACETAAWQALPDGAALPSGWSMVSNRVFVDNLLTTLAGPTPSPSGQRPAVFTSLSCYASDAPLAIRRAHEAALAAGGADVSFAKIGDESFVVFSPASSTTTLYIRRGALVADVSADTSVDRSTLEAIGRTVDAAMVRSLAASPDAAAIAQPSPVALASPAPSSAASPSAAPSGPAASPSAPAESHVAPDLEKLLPSRVGTTSIAAQSVLGSTALGSSPAAQALVASLKNLGKTPADLQIAGAYDPTGTLDLSLFAYRVKGIDPTELGRAVIESQMSNSADQATSSQVTIGGQPITKISYAKGSPVYFYLANGVVYAVQSGDANLVASIIGLLK